MVGKGLFRKVLLHLLKSLENPAVFLAYRKTITWNYKKVKSILRREKYAWGGERCLDLPCGPGDMSQFLDGKYYVGLDLSKRYVEYAKRRFPSEFIVGDARELPFQEGTFDRVISIGSLHHVADEGIIKTGEEIARVLRQEGVFILVDIVMPSSKLAFLERIIIWLDRGKYVRSPEQYDRLFFRKFSITRKYNFIAWPWRYCLSVLMKRKREL